MIQIDGSQGEGGGQIIRSSLALAMVTETSVRIDNVRAGRKKPGLLRQHLTALRAATQICGAEVEGDAMGSNTVTLEVEHEHVTEVFTGFGQVGRPAEAVANQAIQQCQRYLKSDAVAGEYLTDQLMLPLALAGGGSFTSTGLSRHATTHLDLIRRFLDVEVTVNEEDRSRHRISFNR